MKYKLDYRVQLVTGWSNWCPLLIEFETLNEAKGWIEYEFDEKAKAGTLNRREYHIYANDEAGEEVHSERVLCYVKVRWKGESCDYINICEGMKDVIRDSVHQAIAPCTPQEFVDAYARLYKLEYGEEYKPSV